MIKRTICILTAVFLLLPLAACGKPAVQRFSDQYTDSFDTVTQVTIYASDQKTFEENSRLIHDELLKYHRYYDIYKEYEGIANIKTINDNAGIAPVKVSQEVMGLLLFSREMYRITEGRTNVALGSVLKIWHEYRSAGLADPQKAQVPGREELEKAARHTDMEKLIINEKDSTVYLADPLMSLDVGAVAKGYAAEQTSRKAREAGVSSGLISVGGNVCVIGVKADSGGLWKVGVQNPDIEDTEQPYIHLVEIADRSLVTSGDYIRFYTANGKKYHHIIDPSTLYPSDYCRSVTIICADSGKADALSTALFCMPWEEGLSLVEKQEDAEAMWVLSDGEERFSSGFEALMTE